MTRPCPWTVVLLACLCSAFDFREFSAYNKKLELLSTIVNKDYLWKHIFLESIVLKLDRTYYGHIIDSELLNNARYESLDGEETTDKVVASESDSGEMPGIRETSSAEVTPSSTPSENDTSDRIIPYKFVRNIMLYNRFVVESILDLGLQVLMVSFKCLMFKHIVHLLYLIQTVMKRDFKQKKAASWAGKSKPVIELILMKMGELQFTDTHVLSSLSFFDIYNRYGESMGSDVKHNYCDHLEKISDEMLDYIGNNCVKIPKSDEKRNKMKQLAEMIGISTTSKLYNNNIIFRHNVDYKKIINDSWEKLNGILEKTPWINNTFMSPWGNIFQYETKFSSIIV